MSAHTAINMEPRSIEGEQSLLGAVLMNPAAFDVVEGRVDAADFYEPIHAAIWRTFAAARKDGRTIDFRLTVSALGQDAKAEIVPGMTIAEYVAKLGAEATTIAGARDYAEHIRELADLRRMIAVADEMKGRATSVAMVNPADVARAGIEALDAIVAAHTTFSSPRVSVAQATEKAFTRMIQTKDSGKSISGVAWQLSEVDDATLGLNRGEMVLIGARPSMGKTALGLSTALKAARAGHGVLFFSLEMDDVGLGERVLADISYDHGTPITYRAIRGGNVDDAEIDRLAWAQDKIRTSPLVVEQEPGVTVGQISARARKLAAKWQREAGPSLDLIVVDHVHLVKASDRYSGNRTGELTEISGALKGLAKELNAAVLVLCQLSRANETREDKRPQLSDLRDSGALEQDADVVIFLYRESYYLERRKGKDDMDETERVARLIDRQNILEIAIAKQRQGPIKTVEVFCDIACNAIRNLGR